MEGLAKQFSKIWDFSIF